MGEIINNFFNPQGITLWKLYTPQDYLFIGLLIVLLLVTYVPQISCGSPPGSWPSSGRRRAPPPGWRKSCASWGGAGPRSGGT